MRWKRTAPGALVFLLAGLAWLTTGFSLAQKAAPASQFPPRSSAAQTMPAGPVPAVQPVANAVYTLPPDLLTKAVALDRIRTLLALGDTLWTLMVLLGALWLHWPARLRDWAERSTDRWWLQGLMFLPPAVLFLAAIPLPLALYAHHVGLTYGLSVQRWGSWAADETKSLLLSLAVFVPLLLAGFWIVRRSPRRWWLWFWAGSIPVIVFAVFVSPLLIDPIFNRFAPLATSDPQLTARLESLAHHAGLNIPASRIFLMRASDKVTGVNAYVTGLGASKRIVVWDTTTKQLRPDEILFVVGHEMGHYVLNHIDLGLGFAAAMLLLGFWLLFRVERWLLGRCGAAWQIRGPDDWAALAVLMLVTTALSFLSLPVGNGFSRWEEHAADVYGQEAIHGLVAHPRQSAVSAFDALGRLDLEAPHPNPWIVFWFDSHPSTAERVRFAAQYDPWIAGRHPRYFRK